MQSLLLMGLPVAFGEFLRTHLNAWSGLSFDEHLRAPGAALVDSG